MVETITYNDANAMYKKMYNEDLPTLHVNGLRNNSQDYVLYEYLNDRDIFVKLDFYGAGGTCSSTNIRKVKKAIQEDNLIKIYVLDYESGYFELDDNIYHFQTNRLAVDIECNNEKECMNIIKSNYINFLDEYEIVFKVVNNQITFKEVNKLV